MKKELKELLIDVFETIPFEEDFESPTKRTIEFAEKGNIDAKCCICEALMDYETGLEPEDFDNDWGALDKEQNFVLDSVVELGSEIYSEDRQAGSAILSSAYRNYHAAFKLNPATNKYEEDLETEAKRHYLSEKFARESYEKYNNVYSGVALADMILSDANFGCDPSEAFKILNKLFKDPECPPDAYCIYGKELLMGKNIPQDVERGKNYFDKAIAMGDEFAAKQKEHFIKMFVEKSGRRRFW